MQFLKKVNNQKGQGVMEYIIISSLVGIFCLVAIKQFGSVIQTRINDMKSHIVKNIKVN
jgi:Tfp pilus assembly protein PilE